MKILILLACYLLPFFTFSKVLPSTPLDEFRENLHMKLIGLLTYAERAENWRHESKSLQKIVFEDLEKNGGVLGAKELSLLHDHFNIYMDLLRKPIKDLIDEGAFNFDYDASAIWENYDHFVLISDQQKTHSKKSFFGQNTYFVNPKDDMGKKILGEFYFTLAANLVLMDNYAVGIYPFLENKQTRMSLFTDLERKEIQDYNKRQIFKENIFTFDELDILTKHEEEWTKLNKESSLRSTELRRLWIRMERSYKNSQPLISAIKFYEKSIKKVEKFKGSEQYRPFLEAFRSIVENSVIYSSYKESGAFEHYINHLKNKIRYDFRFARDWKRKKLDDLTMDISKAFGNAVGKFQTRNGKLKSLSNEEKYQLQSEMKPLDILLEKTPFRLTDRFIPGHYGHVAIWTGTDIELQEIGIWGLLDVLHFFAVEKHHYKGPSFQETIRNGHFIIEALRPGVQINSLEHFLDIDDLAVLRAKKCLDNTKNCFTKKDMFEALYEAFEQIGKEYDFNFDVNTQEKIVCSELAYRSFKTVDWDTKKTLGKYSISPDQVAKKANGRKDSGEDRQDPFFPAIIYFNGQRVIQDNLSEVFSELLSKNYKKVQELTQIPCEEKDYCRN